MAEHAEDTRVKDALELLNSYAKDKRGELQDLLSIQIKIARQPIDSGR